MHTHAVDIDKKVTIALLGRSILPSIQDLPNVEMTHGVYQCQVAEGVALLFNYAVMVFWGVGAVEQQRLVEMVSPYVQDPISRPIVDSLRYVTHARSGFSIQNDQLTLPEADVIVYLALSHAFAQSTKLAFFEESAEAMISQNLSIPKKLARTGKIPLRRKALARLRGVLFDTSCDITLNFNLLDKPNFFWDHPHLDVYYCTLSKYLEMDARTALLNQKLSMIHELLEMLAEEQKHKQSSALEWVIITLIAVEIILYILPARFYH